MTRTTLHDVTIAELKETQADYKQCSRMGFRDDGCIRYDLDIIARDAEAKKTSRAIMVKDPTGRIRAWGLLDTRGVKPTIMLWTQHRWRRKGLGRKIMDRVRALVGDNFYHFVVPENARFFDKALTVKSLH